MCPCVENVFLCKLMSAQVFMYTGLVSTLYSVYAGIMYYTLSGKGLVKPSQIQDLNVKHIIDVRTKFEYKMGHHKNAIHIPLGTLSKKTMKNIPLDDVILVYCNTGQRARMGADILRKLGYKNVYYIQGSYKTIP